MNFSTLLFLFISAVGLSLAQSQQCSALANYHPALVYCAIKYPIAVPTTTSTTTKTMAQSTPTSPGTAGTSTTRGGGKKSTRTMTAIVTKTITDCGHIPFPTCLPELDLPIEWPSILDGKLGNHGLRAIAGRAYKSSEQGSGYSQALAWTKILTQGDMAARNLCSCIQPRPKTATVSALSLFVSILANY